MTDGLAQLLRAAFDLGQDELALLTQIAERLTKGRAQYGALHLATDRRDWHRETTEELLDAAVYLAAAVERRTRTRGDA